MAVKSGSSNGSGTADHENPDSVASRGLNPAPAFVRIENPFAIGHPDGMKKVVVFSDSSIFVHVVEDTAAEKTEE